MTDPNKIKNWSRILPKQKQNKKWFNYFKAWLASSTLIRLIIELYVFESRITSASTPCSSKSPRIFLTIKVRQAN